MATGRFLSTTIAIDGQLARLSTLAEMMYLKCIPHLDRDGMITGEPLGLLGIISPMRFSEVHAAMPALIDEWVQIGLVIRFPFAGGYALFFKGFLKQQSLKYGRERASQFPPPPGYIRTEAGLRPATDVPWTTQPADSGFSPENPAKPPVLQELPGQQQQQQQEQQQEQQQQQQQQQEQGAAAPAQAAAAEQSSETLLLLRDWGVGEPELTKLSVAPPEHVRGWMWEAEQAGTRLRDPVAFVVARLKARLPSPRPLSAEEWDALHVDEDPDSYEALRRRYVPEGWSDVIVH